MNPSLSLRFFVPLLQLGLPLGRLLFFKELFGRPAAKLTTKDLSSGTVMEIQRSDAISVCRRPLEHENRCLPLGNGLDENNASSELLVVRYLFIENPSSAAFIEVRSTAHWRTHLLGHPIFDLLGKPSPVVLGFQAVQPSDGYDVSPRQLGSLFLGMYAADSGIRDLVVGQEECFEVGWWDCGR
jgi:hypothetical protein